MGPLKKKEKHKTKNKKQSKIKGKKIKKKKRNHKEKKIQKENTPTKPKHTPPKSGKKIVVSCISLIEFLQILTEFIFMKSNSLFQFSSALIERRIHSVAVIISIVLWTSFPLTQCKNDYTNIAQKYTLKSFFKSTMKIVLTVKSTEVA